MNMCLFSSVGEKAFGFCPSFSCFILEFYVRVWERRAVSICFSHMEWKNDALGIYFAHMKNDQLGERPRDPRNV